MDISKIESTVTRVIAEQTGVELSEIKPETRLIEDLNWDSLDPVEMVMELEDELDICIMDGDAEKLKTVADVIAYVQKVKA